jgi:transposase
MQSQGEFTFTKEQFFALVELNKTLVERDKTNQNLIAALELKVLHLTEKYNKLANMVFGSKSERFEGLNNPNQLGLALGLEEITPSESTPETVQIEYTRTKKTDAEKPVRSALPADLPRVVIEIQPEEDTTGMKCIGYEITEQLEMTPSMLLLADKE